MQKKSMKPDVRLHHFRHEPNTTFHTTGEERSHSYEQSTEVIRVTSRSLYVSTEPSALWVLSCWPLHALRQWLLRLTSGLTEVRRYVPVLCARYLVMLRGPTPTVFGGKQGHGTTTPGLNMR